jgi:hypothetical protein
MRRNFVWAEGGPWFINPPLLHYVALELGKSVFQIRTVTADAVIRMVRIIKLDPASVQVPAIRSP